MSAYLTDANRLRITQIKEAKQESPKVKTFVLNDENCQKAIPGQFVMVWIPGLDEVPMSVSRTSPSSVSICVKSVGQATNALHEMRTGDQIGIRGPFGNGFAWPKNGSVLIVGGGTGLIPLAFLAEKLAGFPVEVTFVAGARTEDDLLFQHRIESFVRKSHGKIIVTTDDGSCGIKCTVTEPVEELLAKERFDMVYTCGPEHMMVKMLSFAEQHHLSFQASLERLMRCAIGICGSCVIGGFRVCVDGPVFTKEQLQPLKDEFGRFRLDFDGRKMKT